MTGERSHGQTPPDLQRAAQALRACRNCAPLEAASRLREAALAVTRVRNHLIGPAQDGDARARPQLARINALLSMLASLEFPLSGLARDRLDELIAEIDSV